MLNKPNTIIDLDIQTFAQKRLETGLTIFCGSNNSGKSYLLKKLYEGTGDTSYFLAVQRFFNARQFASSNLDPNKKHALFQNFLGNFQNENVNDEQNPLDLNRIITDLSDLKREELFKICGRLLNQKLVLVDIQPSHKFSPSYIEVDGINMSYVSAGTRLLITLIGTLIDDGYDTFFLDEPELGLTPRIQAALVNFLYDSKNRKKYFPHLKNLYISTHSHIFLDRKSINNNFTISKTGDTIHVKQITDMHAFNTLQFNLLGNTFESLFLPSAIVICEGPTDYKYIKRSFELLFPDNKITIISTNSDGEINREILHLENVLLDISKSPYRDRIFIVTDKQHSSPTLISDIEKKKIPRDQIVEWNNNGIEFVYPKAVLEDIFSCNSKQVDKMSIDKDGKIEINNIIKTKEELSNIVITKLTNDTKYPTEYMVKLIDKVKKAIS